MKAFVYKTSGRLSEGKILESENLETLCNSILVLQDFGKFSPGIVVSKPNMDYPSNELEKQCEWVIEIYDDYRE